MNDELVSSVHCSCKLTDIPVEVFLEDTFATDAELYAQSVKSTFGGGGLITSVKDGHVVIRNLSDLVAMKANNRDASFRIKVNRSVAGLPVDVLLNSGTHLGFDLTHEVVDFFDSFNIHDFGALWGDSVPLSGLAQGFMIFCVGFWVLLDILMVCVLRPQDLDTFPGH